MKKISIVLLICFCSLISKPSFAETPSVEQEWDYLEINQGSPAPINGLLFSYEGMSNAISRVQQKIKLVMIENEAQKEKLKIELEAKIKLSDAKLIALQEQHDNQMSAKNETITNLTKDLELSKVKGYAGVILGIAAGVLITGLIYGNK